MMEMIQLEEGGRGRGRGRGRGSGRQCNNEDEPRPDPIQQQILNMLEQQQQTMNGIRTDLGGIQQRQDHLENRMDEFMWENYEEIHEEPPLANLPPEPEVDIQAWLSRFSKQQPPAFKGKFDPQVAEDWLARLDKIFDMLACPDEVKARLAIYKLESDADRWWKGMDLILKGKNVPITWELFKEKFNENYFPPTVKREKEKEFLGIKQQDRESFDDYLARYIRLSRYSSYAKLNDNEEWNADMMIEGLRSEFKERLISQHFTKFSKAAEECRYIEKRLSSWSTQLGNKGASGSGSSTQK